MRVIDDFIRDMPYDRWYPTKGNQEVVELIKEYINLDVFFPDAVMCLNKDESKFQKSLIPKEKKIEKVLDNKKERVIFVKTGC